MNINNHSYNYFYKITNKINNHFYYGVHCTDNLDDGYMGSGKRLHSAFNKYGIENFNKEILKFFDTPEDAYKYEAEVVNETLVRNPDCYNLIPGGRGINLCGMVVVKDKDNNTFVIQKDDPRYLSRELVGVAKGTVVVRDNQGNYFAVDKNDERYLSGELKSIWQGRVSVRDKNNNNFLVDKNDPRYLSGEVVPITTGKFPVKDKDGNTFDVSCDDPRYLSGELTAIWKGKHHKVESRNKTRNTMTPKESTNSRVWVSKDGCTKYLRKDLLTEYLENGWELGRINYKPRKNCQGKLL